jgi:hypothetical protein
MSSAVKNGDPVPFSLIGLVSAIFGLPNRCRNWAAVSTLLSFWTDSNPPKATVHLWTAVAGNGHRFVDFGPLKFHLWSTDEVAC